MKKKILALSLMTIALVSCGRHLRTAEDITPGNTKEKQLSWKYGAGDIRIQTSKITKELMDRWAAKVAPSQQGVKPRIVITQIDNRTDMVLSSDMIRDTIESVAINDGRCTIVVGDSRDEEELNRLLNKEQTAGKYDQEHRPEPAKALAPQFLGKIRIVKAITEQKKYDIEDYRMTITLYDIETQEAVDSAFDILRKKVEID